MKWPENPSVFEVNTWPWLAELSRRYNREVTLGDVPDWEWERLKRLGMDAVWLMGVHRRSAISRREGLAHKGLLNEFRQALPDFGPEDVVGSPYAVAAYEVDDSLGGIQGLDRARALLSRLGMRLILDFVPNHTACDHPWVQDFPSAYISGHPDLAEQRRDSWFRSGNLSIAHGRDPYFPAWTDTAQINPWSPEARDLAVQTLSRLSRVCDGVRCDMAMLMLSDVVERTWGAVAGPRPDREYWAEVTSRVRDVAPDFLFLGEAYWNLEWTLLQMGFDYCYDKTLYDRLEKSDARSIKNHISGDALFTKRLAHFIENHDEPRVAAQFAPGRREAAAVIVAGLPGMRLWHSGQTEGRRVRLPVQLGRGTFEPADPRVAEFYERLLTMSSDPVLRSGDCVLLEPQGWPDNRTSENLLAFQWTRRDYGRVYGELNAGPGLGVVVVVNYSEMPAQGLIPLSCVWPADSMVIFEDVAGGQTYYRPASELGSAGLFVDLGPWSYHWFRTYVS